MMKTLAVLLVIFLAGTVEGKGPQNKAILQSAILNDIGFPEKRNVIQFGFMITCATARFALDYNDYGNHCGLGGGGTPVDNVDRCCQVHDQCYKKYNHCYPLLTFYDPGFIKSWSSSSNNNKCVMRCDDTDSCKKAVCECDRVAAECFAKHPYNSNHKNSWWGRRRR